MGLSYSSAVNAALDEVFAWHTRPGALRRLMPPWLPLEVVAEASSLRDGRAVVRLWGPLQWVSQHRTEGYDPPNRFVDEVVNLPWRLAGWRHSHSFAAANGGSTVVQDSVETSLPAGCTAQVFSYRHRQLAGDLAAHSWANDIAGRGAAPDANVPQNARSGGLTVAMTGTSGLVGSELAAFLTSGGHRVVRLVRRPPAGPDEREWGPVSPAPGLLAGVDAVVHLAGAPIARRFSESHKQAVWDSRVLPTQRLAEAAAREASENGRPRCFISASAVGFYGYDRGDELLDEASARGEGFLAHLVAAWEAATSPAADAGVRTVNIRTGLVQWPRGGVLGALYPVFLVGLGARLGAGQQWVPWVSMDDLVEIYLRALVDNRLSGPVNAVSAHPVRASEYSVTLARVLHRPALFSVPPLPVALALGREGAREFAFASQRAVPAALEGVGHSFRHGDLEVALRHMLGRWQD